MASNNFQSNGLISPSVFVQIDPTSNERIIQAANGSFPIGISSEGAQYAPIPGASSLAATSGGQSLNVYGIGDVTLLNATASGWTAGALLMPAYDGSGFGLTATGGANYGAIALESITTTGLGRVQ